jgi:hypothetical protein
VEWRKNGKSIEIKDGASKATAKTGKIITYFKNS